MKKFSILFFGAVLSFLVQTIILYYLNNFYFTNNTQINFKEVNLESAVSANLEVKLEPDAENINLSPSGKYCSYYSQEKLNIVSLVNGKKNSLNLDKNLKSYYFKWHNTEDKLIISEKTIKNNKKGIKIYTYNPKNNIKQEALNYNNKSEIYKLPSSNSIVDGIELNPMNTIMYLKTSISKGTHYLERLDISTGMNKLNINTTKVGKFFVLKQKDELIYENLANDKLYITDKSKNKEIKIPSYKNLKLLYVDKNDTAFIGEFQNNMITKIFKKALDETSEKNTWDSLPLEKPISEDNLHILNSGKVYVIDNLKGSAENIQDKTKVTFKGNFIAMNDSRILSSYNEKLIVTSLNQ
ncbi:hypothetical protein RBU49_05440 [Clostridium sp. MB40-C1]|uniref:hypothetical protein n=1 Tax=Clostridium sp. MB40-C1 TaxID=3070996 RepID=UPI0027E08B1D|nr:hypothetical protein [Clostridium sp. MB40-C1]WMJ81691.1 hypothetical protein RBU49_05440 [Clostridium sp. MB40-C1]